MRIDHEISKKLKATIGRLMEYRPDLMGFCSMPEDSAMFRDGGLELWVADRSCIKRWGIRG